MSRPTLTAQIDACSATLSPESLDDWRIVVYKLQENHAEASKNSARYGGLLILAWATFYSVGIGIVTEGQVSSLKFPNPKMLLIAAPPLLGLLFYLWSSAMNSANLLALAFSESFKCILPEMYKRNLEYLLLSPSIWTVETVLEKEAEEAWINRFQDAWRDGLMIAAVIGSFAAVIHLSTVLWRVNVYHPASVTISVLVGLVLWLRGFVMARVANRMRNDP
jgi:hypothetical protein